MVGCSQTFKIGAAPICGLCSYDRNSFHPIHTHIPFLNGVSVCINTIIIRDVGKSSSLSSSRTQQAQIGRTTCPLNIYKKSMSFDSEVTSENLQKSWGLFRLPQRNVEYKSLRPSYLDVKDPETSADIWDHYREGLFVTLASGIKLISSYWT